MKITLIAITVLIIAACSTVKKSKSTDSSATTNSITSSTVTATPTATISKPVLVVKSSTGVYAPGNEELIAIQAQYKDVTLDHLQEGYAIYTNGACVNCHSAFNIYENDVVKWKNIIDDMAERAEISATQKDAVYKYVLSIKATQPK